jgi:hypothetical protein
MRLVTSMRKRGRRISVVDVELIQGDRAAVHLGTDGPALVELSFVDA